MSDKSSQSFAIAQATIQELLTAGWHPDRIIETIAPILKDYPDWSESLTSDMVWGDYETFKELGISKTSHRPLANEIKTYISCLEEPDIYLSEVYEELKITSPGEKAAAQTAFSRLSHKEGPLQKVGRGHFRIKAPECPDIDIFSQDTPPPQFSWPLKLGEHFVAMPKNIIIIAGEPDAGKTAFLLNFTKRNMYAHNIYYFSSEMGKAELKGRLLKFGAPIETWKNVHWKERAGNFPDVIQANAVNIIDFLEIHDEFYKIGGTIKEIFDKLDTGIALIALQKNTGRDEGLGGFRSMEKARLYISMEKTGRAKIIKCKNWRDETSNPNGKSIHYRLGGGCNFKIEDGGDWIREAELGRKDYGR